MQKEEQRVGVKVNFFNLILLVEVGHTLDIKDFPRINKLNNKITLTFLLLLWLCGPRQASFSASKWE